MNKPSWFQLFSPVEITKLRVRSFTFSFKTRLTVIREELKHESYIAMK